MNKRIAYEHSDGSGIAIVAPAPPIFNPESFEHKSICSQNNKASMTQDEVIQYIIDTHVPTRSAYEVMETQDIPNDVFFRDAWEIVGKKVGVNIPKAKGIKLNQIRELRKPLLEKLDLEYTMADEKNNPAEKSLISQKKQALRDVTTITLPDDIEVLRDFIPDILKDDTNKFKK